MNLSSKVCAIFTIFACVENEISLVRTSNRVNNCSSNSKRHDVDVNSIKPITMIKYHSVLESVVDLMIYWRRFKGTFIFDKYSDLTPQKVTYYLSERLIQGNIIFVEEDTITNFNKSNTSSNQNFIIYCRTHILNQLLLKMKETAGFSRIKTFIIVSSKIPSIFKHKLKIHINHQVTILSPNSNLKMESRKRKLKPINRPPINIFLKKCRFNTEIFKLLLSSNTTFKMALVKNNFLKTSIYYLFDVFNDPSINQTEWVLFAKWNSDDRHRLNIFSKLQNNIHQSGLKGKQARIIVFNYPPFVLLQSINDKVYLSGYMKDIMDALSAAFNLRFIIKKTENVFGFGYYNGTYTGVIDILHKNEAEIAMLPMSMTSSRYEGVRYTIAIIKAFLRPVYVRRPPTVLPTTYLMPFTMNVWLTILLIICISLFEIFLILIVLRKFSHQLNKKNLWTATSTRVIYYTILFIFYSLSILYNSTLTAFLTYQEEDIPFKNLRELLSNKEYIIRITSNTSYQDVMQNSKSGRYAELWQRFIQQGNQSFAKSSWEGFYKMQQSPAIVHLIDGPTALYLNRGNCCIAFAPFTFMREYFHLTHRLDFPFTKMLDIGLLKLMEGGIFQRLAKIYHMDKTPYCPRKNSEHSLGIKNVILPFILYACLIFLTLITLIIENIIFLYKFHHKIKL